MTSTTGCYTDSWRPPNARGAWTPPDPRAEERKAAEQARLAKSGILAIVNSNDVSYERLPMLDIVFDRLVRPDNGDAIRTVLPSAATYDDLSVQ